LYDPDTLLIEATLGESAAGKVAPGGKAEILIPQEDRTLPQEDRTLAAEIQETAPEVDSRNKSFTVYLKIPSELESPIPGMFVSTRIYTGPPEPALSLPADSLLAPYDQKHGNLLLYRRETEETGRVYRKSVELHGIDNDTVYVSSGIEAGTLVCISPPDLPEGTAVKGAGL
ncbi:MAG: HlyD family efflux transporter periplasmic adaptor subunit, partial [Spirochaetia bacterium]